MTIDPLEVFFWTVRRNEKDVVNLYDTLSPVMQLATGGSMLNFGYWDKDHAEPLHAQNNMCSFFAKMAQLESANSVIDVGSGLASPARLWMKQFPQLEIFCININSQQLKSSNTKNLTMLNSTSTVLPFSDNSVDRVLALESAQHFKPLGSFIAEAKRVLVPNGILAIAIPITVDSTSLTKLGILKFTWSSEHYSLDYVTRLVSEKFRITDEQLIGSDVYEPLADYYLENRQHIKKMISKQYPNYVESILHRSIQKMKKASENKIIDYLILKCIPDN